MNATLISIFALREEAPIERKAAIAVGRTSAPGWVATRTHQALASGTG